MTETVEGRKGGFIADFKNLTPKQWVAIVLALVVSLVLEMYMGTNCMGFLIVAIVLYMVPHLTGVSSVKVKATLGAVFIVIALLIGTFAFSGAFASNEDRINDDGDQIKDVAYDPETDTITFMVDPSVDQFKVHIQYVPLIGVSFGEANRAGSQAVNHYVEQSELTADADGWYAVTLADLGLSEGSYYQVGIGVMDETTEDEDDYTATLIFWYDCGADTTVIALSGTAYTVAFAMILFYMILVFSHMIRASTEKTRAKMEAEGRLYPQGYGRCKECNAMVLPGEVNCRKCGAYIDVPDELRVKKKDFFQCSECGAEVPADATECPKCGAKFDEEQENVVVHEDGTEDVSTQDVACPECGNIVPANADWCPRCGKMLRKE